jgi:hypothetical protein
VFDGCRKVSYCVGKVLDGVGKVSEGFRKCPEYIL